MATRTHAAPETPSRRNAASLRTAQISLPLSICSWLDRTDEIDRIACMQLTWSLCLYFSRWVGEKKKEKKRKGKKERGFAALRLTHCCRASIYSVSLTVIRSPNYRINSLPFPPLQYPAPPSPSDTWVPPFLRALRGDHPATAAEKASSSSSPGLRRDPDGGGSLPRGPRWCGFNGGTGASVSGEHARRRE